MSLDLLLWSIPGLIVLALRNLARSYYPLSQKSTWEYVVELVPFSFTCFISAHLLLKISSIFWPEYYEHYRMLWISWAPYPGSFKLVLSMVVAFPLAKIVPFLSRLFLWYSGRFNVLSENDQNLPKYSLIFATLRNGKVYVGYVIGAASDEALGNRFLRLMPLLSGFRNDKHQVVYNTIYSKEAASASEIRISIGEVVTVGKFEWDVHDEFVKKKSTILRFSRQK